MTTEGEQENNKAPTWQDIQDLKKEFESDKIANELSILIAELTRANAKYRTALEFYASFENYIGQDSFSASIDGDCGEIAREALK